MQTTIKPVRLVMVMSDGTVEPVDLDECGVEDLAAIDLDSRADRESLIEAVRAAVRRFKR